MKCFSVCSHDCPDACALEVEIKDNLVAKISGNKDHPFTQGIICNKTAQYKEVVYSDKRVLYPHKRVGEKGTNAFKRISWDEAIETIVTKWQRILKNYTSDSILPYSYAGTEGVLNNASMDRRFFNKLGAAKLLRTICSAAGTKGFELAYGKAIGTNPIYTSNSKFIVFWGVNALATNLHQAIFAQKARQSGAKIVSIDVEKNETAHFADEFYHINPASDGILALGIANIIINENLYDREFIENNTYGFGAFKELTKQYTPNIVCKQTGLSEKQLNKLSIEYATTHPSFIRIGNGLQHHLNGGCNTWAISLLPALVGAWKFKAGGAIKSNSGYFPINKNLLQRPDLLASKTRTINMVELGKALSDEKNPIKSIYVYNSNPLVVAPNHNLVKKGFQREDLFVVVHERLWTTTALYADIVLPATTFLEHDDLYTSYWHNTIAFAKRAIEPLGESKPNIEVFSMLALAFGFKERCFRDNAYELASQALDDSYFKSHNITLNRLLEEKFIVLENIGYPYKDTAYTKLCKIQFKNEDAVNSTGKDLPECTDFSTHCPFILITPPNKYFLNSTFAHIDKLRKNSGVPSVKINTKDAIKHGIKDNDNVEVFNEQGSCILKAVICEDVKEGVLISRGLYWADDYINKQPINALTSDKLSDIGQGAVFFSTGVELKKL
ncbi:Anaerobic dehydrogenase, typically selenocysteine-containing [Desulfurella amilsii]|uniref:Anaerobic dehydrogenase, typically selenocysteine-containing n=1 Tax=Desulfurella amilsii TaxID=1562698 RepID=A0A1X4XY67_9BACT|nr:molybdopterin-dependent oxidoreductase [Desulfurella amilsii]OSS42468.1 Anaerobic dehydrogenase, typically selenocysteine-containing [Desulfurella amilsii]